MDIEPFVAYLVEQDRSIHTISGYRYSLGLFARWFEQTNRKPMTPEVVTPLDIKAYRSYLVGHKMAPSTINYKLTLLRNYFRWAIEQGQIRTNPLAHIKLFKQTSAAPKWLDKTQTYALLRAAIEAIQLAEAKNNEPTVILGKRNAAMLALMLHAGLRVSEVANLFVTDVEISSRSGQVTVRDSKGGKFRTVPLNADARQALADWLEVWTGTQYLFESRISDRSGLPITPRSVQHAVRTLGQAAGLPGLTPHQLRHTFGKNLIDAGVSIDRVAMLLGHSSIDTTAIYTRPSLVDLEKAVEAISWQD